MNGERIALGLIVFFSVFAIGAKIFALMSTPPGAWAMIPLALVSGLAAYLLARSLP